MAQKRLLPYAKEDLPSSGGKTSVDAVFLVLVLLLLAVGLTMLYSASYAQSLYDTGYTISTKYLQKQAICAKNLTRSRKRLIIKSTSTKGVRSCFLKAEISRG